MCKDEVLHNEEIKEYINIQTGEILDLELVSQLKDNAMLKVKPELWIIWNFEKNDELDFDIWKMTKGSNKKVWWYCEKCNDTYPMAVSKKVNDRGCSICSGYYVTAKNSFGGKFPELAKEWHPTLNGDLTPYMFSYGSGTNIWWKCDTCSESYDTTIDKKTSQKAKCPFCRGLRVGKFNNLAVTHPELANMWNYEKNGTNRPENFVKGSSKPFHWKCKKCGDESYMPISSKEGCAVCANQKVLKGFNDMWTTNPDLAKLLHNPEDGYEYMQWSNQKVDWKCSCCNNIIRNKRIADINKRGLSCTLCSDGFSFGEKVMYKILRDNVDTFENQKYFKWSKGRVYDFYFIINNNQFIIEVHGEQHRNGSFSRLGGRTLEEEQENDKYKYDLAIANGIKPENYIEINIDNMNLSILKKEIENSKIKESLNISEEYMENFTITLNDSLIHDCWRLWNKGYPTMKIVKETGLNKGTVRKYLKLGNELNKCNYNKSNNYRNLNQSKIS